MLVSGIMFSFLKVILFSTIHLKVSLTIFGLLCCKIIMALCFRFATNFCRSGTSATPATSGSSVAANNEVTRKLFEMDGKLNLILEKINKAADSSNSTFDDEIVPPPAKTDEELSDNLSALNKVSFFHSL